jgi:hypothetical protein
VIVEGGSARDVNHATKQRPWRIIRTCFGAGDALGRELEPALGEFLGDMRLFIDLVMDQGEHGMEFIPGRSTYHK